MASGVTVVVPTLPGREPLLARALTSVWAQTRPPVAVALVRDTRRHGAWWARNLGLAMVQTGWTAWLDDDDELLPHHLATLMAAGEATGAGMIYAYPEFIGGRPDPLAVVDNDGHLVASPVHIAFEERQAQWLRRVGNFIPVTYLVRTSLARQVGGMPQPWSPDWPKAEEDHGFLIRLLDAGVRFHNAQQITWRYHFHDANTGGRPR